MKLQVRISPHMYKIFTELRYNRVDLNVTHLTCTAILKLP